MKPNQTLFVLYVKDQQKSTEFYSRVLDEKPVLNVPGMTEFELGNRALLGLMPEKGMENLLGLKSIPNSNSPKSEIYLIVENAEELHKRALDNGAKELSPLLPRDWGQKVAYSLDSDGYVLAFAEE
ncbi:MAG: glyoxalase [Calditrichaeota bacterium]|nr:MAG: glyoxalase [Calditrichota bacterium]